MQVYNKKLHNLRSKKVYYESHDPDKATFNYFSYKLLDLEK